MTGSAAQGEGRPLGIIFFPKPCELCKCDSAHCHNWQEIRVALTEPERKLPVPGPVSDDTIHHGPFPPKAESTPGTQPPSEGKLREVLTRWQDLREKKLLWCYGAAELLSDVEEALSAALQKGEPPAEAAPAEPLRIGQEVWVRAEVVKIVQPDYLGIAIKIFPTKSHKSEFPTWVDADALRTAAPLEGQREAQYVTNLRMLGAKLRMNLWDAFILHPDHFHGEALRQLISEVIIP